MDEPPNITYFIEALVTTFTEVGKAIETVRAVFVEVLGQAMETAQDAHYYEQATGQPYDPSRIVEGSIAPPRCATHPRVRPIFA